MKLIFAILLTAFTSVAFAQNRGKIVNVKEVSRIEHVLAFDEMQGRKTFTPAIDRAADFIAAEFLLPKWITSLITISKVMK